MRRRSRRPTSENRSSAGNRMGMCASSEPQGELHASRRPNSRRSSSIASTSCTNTDATDNHHSQRSSKPGSREMITPGMATRAMRTTDAMSEGMVLPILERARSHEHEARRDVVERDDAQVLGPDGVIAEDAD